MTGKQVRGGRQVRSLEPIHGREEKERLDGARPLRRERDPSGMDSKAAPGSDRRGGGTRRGKRGARPLSIERGKRFELKSKLRE